MRIDRPPTRNLLLRIDPDATAKLNMSTVYHMVHYRLFDAGEFDLRGESLESLCRSALGTTNAASEDLWSRPQDRIFDLADTDSERKVFLNSVADLSSAIFGEMCLVQARDLQAILHMNTSKVQLSELTSAVVYSLDERKAPSGSEFVRGLAYWMAIGNHMFFVKTHSMTSDFIRLYISWLLKERGRVLAEDCAFSLRAEIDGSENAGDIGDIRSLRVSGKAAPQLAVMVAPEESPAREVKTSRRIADRFAQMAQAVPIVEALFGKPKTESLVESLGPDEYLAVEATVKVRGRRTSQSKTELQKIASDLADLSDAKVSIEGKDGKISEGDAILRTRMPFQVQQEGSNLLEFYNVADQLQEVYSRFVKDGKIRA